VTLFVKPNYRNGKSVATATVCVGPSIAIVVTIYNRTSEGMYMSKTIVPGNIKFAQAV